MSKERKTLKDKFKSKNIFKTNLKSLGSLSEDDKIPMIFSEIKALDYDNIKKLYSKYTQIHSLKSNDALYDKSNIYEFTEEGEYFFIEFKNGVLVLEIDKEKCNSEKNKKIFEIKEKIYDSVTILLEIIEKDFKFLRKNFSYILVYNEEKNSSKSNIKLHVSKKAEENIIKFGLGKFKGYFFKNVYTCTVKEFENKFLKCWEMNQNKN